MPHLHASARPIPNSDVMRPVSRAYARVRHDVRRMWLRDVASGGIAAACVPLHHSVIPRRIKRIVACYDGRHYADSSCHITPGLAPRRQRVAAAA